MDVPIEDGDLTDQPFKEMKLGEKRAIWPGARGEFELSLEEFKKWLQKFDKNGDGKISVEVLREAIRAKGGWFSNWKAKRGLKIADKNSNGVIDDNEISSLVEFAQKHLGVVIVKD